MELFIVNVLVGGDCQGERKTGGELKLQECSSR